ncbi:MAG: DUF4827 domain-containing protein [Prevotellaceae bacterium]|jgi:hypothetical protein|nr:DUF4827 domain-containing protein [Prevotellaceae bacterium]
MKQVFTILLTAILAVNLFSCADQTYAKQLKDEENLIKKFLKGKTILNKIPAPDHQWAENEYLKLDDGMYYREIKKGNTQGDSIHAGNEAIIRFKSITLTNPPDTMSNWTVIDFPDGAKFVYGTENYACPAWMAAIALMKYQNSEAEILAPSKTSFNSYSYSYALAYWGVSDDGQSVTPRRYHLKLVFQ